MLVGIIFLAIQTANKKMVRTVSALPSDLFALYRKNIQQVLYSRTENEIF